MHNIKQGDFMDLSNIKKEDYCLHSTFPEVEKNIKKDEKVAKKLIDIYAGSKGEFTAVCQYIYQSFIVKPEYKELSDILENISICEMQHQEIISQILLSMGINPKFCKYIDSNLNICNYWSAGNVKYITDISKFLDYNIKLEEYAINDYNELLKLTTNQNIIDIVKEIIKDEEAHIIVFNKLKTKFNNQNNLRYDINESESEKENDENNNDLDKNSNREIVSIFSNVKPTNNSVKEINNKIINEIKNNGLTTTNTCESETIQIPISDLNNFNDIELKYLNRLEEKVYSPDEIIDG